MASVTPSWFSERAQAGCRANLKRVEGDYYRCGSGHAAKFRTPAGKGYSIGYSPF